MRMQKDQNCRMKEFGIRDLEGQIVGQCERRHVASSILLICTDLPSECTVHVTVVIYRSKLYIELHSSSGSVHEEPFQRAHRIHRPQP